MWRTIGATLICVLTLVACDNAPSAIPTNPPSASATDSAGTESRPEPDRGESVEPVEPEGPTTVSSDLLVTGNTFWGRYIQRASAGDTSWPFQLLKGFDRSAYDAWATTLECPAVNSDDPFELQETILKFHCEPKFLPEAAKWFDVFSLANNHSDNQGPEGLTATKRNLDRNGIAWFGNPDPEVLDEVCRAIAIQVHVDAPGDQTGYLPIVFCGYHGVFRTPSAASIAQITPWSKRLPVIVMPHSGLEYVPAPDSMKVDLYRAFIDAGADVVLGDHAHWVQNTEAYKGHLIVYGMGNFMFDQQGDLEKRRSAGIKVRITTKDRDLADWLEVGAACQQTPARCGDLVMEAGLGELDAKWQFGVVGSVNPEMLTRPASAAETASIKERLRWPQTMAGLRGPYAAMTG